MIAIATKEGFNQVPKVTSMGYMIAVPEGFEPMVKRATLWDEAVKARAVKALKGCDWVTVEEGAMYGNDTAYCINVEMLKDWYRKAIAIRNAESEYFNKQLQVLEME